MKVILQRVKKASVKVEDDLIASISFGFLILLGIEATDNQEDINWLCRKITNLRVFSDENDAMNKSILEVDGEILVVSQFTLHASTKKGNRPSFIKAARPEIAIPLYKNFILTIENMIKKTVQTGEFGSMMEVALINDGPVTIIIDSKNKE
ncbi:MAG: D-aminoacyl-tRNA deacylase [Flavobacteriales bacterium]